MKAVSLAVLAALALAGCTLTPGDRATIRTRDGLRVDTRGPAQRPAAVESETTVAEITLPAGTRLDLATPQTATLPAPSTAAESGDNRSTPDRASRSSTPQTATAAALTLAAPAVLRVETRREKITAAQSYPPPAAPSLEEQTAASGLRLFYWIGAASAVAAILCFVLRHWAAGITCAVAAAAVPLCARWVNTLAASGIALACAVAAAVFVLAWYLIEWRKRSAAPQA
ncbi:MAG: hypothetical protein NDI75_07590 [Candidatus Didemnitutus sp.]|nr:hypothetical protein [Candidatus Didemnitutus sp.]